MKQYNKERILTTNHGDSSWAMGITINAPHLRWFSTIDQRSSRRQINRVARLPFSVLRMIFDDLRYSMRSTLLQRNRLEKLYLAGKARQKAVLYVRKRGELQDVYKSMQTSRFLEYPSRVHSAYTVNPALSRQGQ